MTAMKTTGRRRSHRTGMALMLGLLIALGAAHGQVRAQAPYPIYTTRCNCPQCSQYRSDDHRSGSWWDLVCNSVKSWRRHLRRSHQEANQCLYHPKYEPHFSGTYGYYETQWGAFPFEDYYIASESRAVDPVTPWYPSPPPRLTQQDVPSEHPSDAIFLSAIVPDTSEAPGKPDGPEVAADLRHQHPVGLLSGESETVVEPTVPGETQHVQTDARSQWSAGTTESVWRPTSHDRRDPRQPLRILPEPREVLSLNTNDPG